MVDRRLIRQLTKQIARYYEAWAAYWLSVVLGITTLVAG